MRQDISQTEGPAITQPARPELLHGQAPAGLWDGLAAQIAAAGFTLEQGDCGDANGRTNFDMRVVRVSAGVDDAMAAKTACHELAHVLLHDGTEYASGCRGRAEVEAESVAYLVCDRAGLLTDGYTFAYIAGWSGGDADTVRATADRVLACARQIADTLALEPTRPTGRVGTTAAPERRPAHRRGGRSFAWSGKPGSVGHLPNPSQTKGGPTMADSASPQPPFRLGVLCAPSSAIDVGRAGVRLVDLVPRRLSWEWDDVDERNHAVTDYANPDRGAGPCPLRLATRRHAPTMTEAYDSVLVTIPRLCPICRLQGTGHDVEPETARRWN